VKNVAVRGLSMVSICPGKHATFDTTKIRNELGWQPRDTRECVRDTMDWLKGHRPAPWYGNA
jgi:nucleoside-diphosphate-sugar epimerase